jgi:DNA-binding NarL/FixJ family response regulator
MLTAHPIKEFAVRCIRAGASGYLNKNASTEEIAEALLVLLNGERYITADVAVEMASHLEQGTDAEPAHRHLSNREFEILRNIAAGQTVSEVALGLGLSTKTVSTYRTRLLKKLQLENNAQLMQYAIKHGLSNEPNV